MVEFTSTKLALLEAKMLGNIVGYEKQNKVYINFGKNAAINVEGFYQSLIYTEKMIDFGCV